jgi:hypothetical protein
MAKAAEQDPQEPTVTESITESITESVIAEVPMTAEQETDYVAAQRTEYSLRALVNLYWDGMLAIPAGALVPISHPGAPGWEADGLVERTPDHPLYEAPQTEAG